ncbi:MAG: mannosyltransferase family protein [Candidatus Pacebacteria bacterium]|nr:mannosyltransferase family protein [Candidatus Paceibacterota bacterium]
MKKIREEYKKIAAIFLIWMLVVNLFALFAFNRFNLEDDTAYGWMAYGNYSFEKSWDPIALHSRWDSLWYLDIAQNGYRFDGLEQLSNIVFFPLYPILISIASFFTAGDFVLAGWAISSLFLFLSLVYLFKITKKFHPEADPFLAIFLLLIFPTAFFLNAVYTESLFLFLTVAAFYYGMEKNFVRAGIFGMLVSLTRITGILLFIPLLWEFFRSCDFKLKNCKSPNILPLFLIPLGTLIFFLYHYFRFGNFFLFLDVEKAWGRAFSLQEEHFQFLTSPAIVNFLLDAFFVIFILAVTSLVFKKLRFSYGLYMLSTVALAISTGTLMSVGRYFLILFPIYILLASVKNQYVRQAWILASTLFFAMYTILFVNNYWAG